MKGYKGFDKDLCCDGNGKNRLQYKMGETHTHYGPLSLCNSGLHFVLHPLDVLGYYRGAGSRYAEVEAEGVTDEQKLEDTKRVARSIKVVAELSLADLTLAAVKFVFEKVDWTKAEEKATGDGGAASATGYGGAASATGTRGAASATGYGGAASATGTRGAASATGDGGAASATGTRGAAFASGWDGKARAAKGGWITVAEWCPDKDGIWQRVDVKTAKVDGKRIKADTYYQLKNGKFVEVKDE